MPQKEGFPRKRPYSTTVKLSEQQRYLWRRKLAASKLSGQYVLQTMINAWLTGEWEPPERHPLTKKEQQQAYKVWGEDGFDPEDGLPPELVDEDEADAIDLEELGERAPRWYIRDLQAYINAVTGRDVRLSTLYKFLQTHFPKNKRQWAYMWDGEDDPQIAEIMELVEEGELEVVRDENLAKIWQSKQAKRNAERSKQVRKQTGKQVKKKT